MGSHAFSMYRSFSNLFSRGIHIADILRWMNIEKIYLYGYGEMGRIVVNDLRKENTIAAVFDRSVTNASIINSLNGETIDLLPITQIPDDDIPVVIAISTNVRDVMDELVESGVMLSRLISLNVLLRYGIYYLQKKERQINRSDRKAEKEFLITGVNFTNKGSQAMTFVAMSELRSRFADAIIWICPNFIDKIYDEREYDFILLDDGCDKNSTVYEVMPRITAIINVSGYAWASYKSFGAVKREMTYLEMADRFGIPVFLMPQSFGPLEYPRYRMASIAELLKVPKVIFARERKGEELLLEKFALDNVKLSVDMVLQADNVHKEYIYFENEIRKMNDRQVNIETDSVIVMPNENLRLCLKYDEVVELYGHIIEKLYQLGEKVYLFSHGADEKLCKSINEKVGGKVEFIDGDLDCTETERLISACKYSVSSRYHGAVHSYRAGKPCILIGWADKYIELAENVNQKEYVIDARDGQRFDDLCGKIEKMNKVYVAESNKIEQALRQIRMTNCFDMVENYCNCV